MATRWVRCRGRRRTVLPRWCGRNGASSLIRAWNEHGWIDLAARVGEKIGRSDRRRTGLHDRGRLDVDQSVQVPERALALRPGRPVILTETGIFRPICIWPRDLAALTGCAWCVDDPLAALDR